VGGALIVGIVAGLAGLWGVTALKRWLRVDDPCDVFGVHGVCGIVGCIMTGIFAATSLGGVGYAEGVTMGHQVLVHWKVSPSLSYGLVSSPLSVTNWLI
jgi:Amt family ammonium transporter